MEIAFSKRVLQGEPVLLGYPQKRYVRKKKNRRTAEKVDILNFDNQEVAVTSMERPKTKTWFTDKVLEYTWKRREDTEESRAHYGYDDSLSLKPTAGFTVLSVLHNKSRWRVLNSSDPV